jgi:predicted metal-dependent hydrolase
MIDEMHSVDYDSELISFKLRRSDRRTISLRVHYDTRVEVSSPINVSISKIYELVQKRASWIIAKQQFFKQNYVNKPTRKFLSGETHKYLGREYNLKVSLGLQNQVSLSGDDILIIAHYPRNSDLIKDLFENWLSDRAYEIFKERLDFCLSKFPNTEKFLPTSMVIKTLKSSWGSMTKSKRLVLNKRLIHAPTECIDYVIVHELCHIQHFDHSSAFWNLVASILPNWKELKKQLTVVMSDI